MARATCEHGNAFFENGRPQAAKAVQIGDSHDDEGIAAGDRLMLSSAGDPNICGQLSIPTSCLLCGMGCEGMPNERVHPALKQVGRTALTRGSCPGAIAQSTPRGLFHWQVSEKLGACRGGVLGGVYYATNILLFLYFPWICRSPEASEASRGEPGPTGGEAGDLPLGGQWKLCFCVGDQNSCGDPSDFVNMAGILTVKGRTAE